MKWKRAKISEVCQGIYDGPHATPSVSEEGAVFLGISNITPDGHLDLSSPKYIGEKDLPKWTKRVTPQEGDIVFSYEATLNLYAIIPKGFRGCLGRRMALIRPDEEKVLGKFLYYYFFSDEWRGMIAENTVIGATVDRIPLIRFPNFPVSFPPVEKQRLIMSVLSAYDDLIENNQKQIKLLEEAAQRLYKEWFVDLRFPGHENTKITDGIPEGWEYKPIFDVFDFVRGRSYTSNELSDSTGVLMVNLKNIRAFGGYNRNAEKRFVGQFKDNQILSAGDVIMGVTDMTQERRLVGHVALVPNMGETMIFSMDLIKLIPKRTDNLFLYSAMIFGGVSKRISPLANGVNVLHLKPEAIMGVEMLIPNDKVVCQYHSQMAPVFSEIETLQKQCDIAAEARDRLLSKLMNGEKRGG